MPSVKFQARFAPLVQVGQKTQTIRPERKRPIKVGERLLLDTWEGKPYRSKVRRLGNAIVQSVQQIKLDQIWVKPATLGPVVYVDGKLLWADELLALAIADGFSSVDDFVGWFRQTHGLPFCGVIIRWELLKAHG